ncbi:vWA domain-containing protein [Pinibacter soli]|uniref:von Willebrand factor type A domain-containing protein n=1 Tax=Pinibacter soli TaxID=3044211 RepID=A0ABT6RAL7_9BACT|nr:von Willebrand factor type A domain-containing protein [Pinibacter soli]MDI3319585.1 von Willebrand factor type A domain-containing protein [Pinibacter soli]
MKTLLSVLLVYASTFLFTAQPIVITGKITDEKGNSLQGVTVTIKGTKTSVSSGANGSYSITVADEKATLSFAFVGYYQEEIKVKGMTVIDVKLRPVAQSLNEVVVVGYGAQRKMDMTTSASVSTALSGRVAGVVVQGYSGSKLVRIRGNSTNKSKDEDYNREGYDNIKENTFQKVTDHPLSTFSIDVDAASYSNVRRLINEGTLPTPGAVRVEEMINYFSYNYSQPKDGRPFSVTTESTQCPWNKEHQLVMIGLQGKKIDYDKLPPSNLVFLIDVSGSMESADKLPLVKSSLQLLSEQLRPQDKIAIVVYAGNAGLVLPSTNDKQKIKEAINALEAGGSTAGGAGIELAYKTAQQNFMKEGNNRVILCTDGDFNVGASSDDALENLIEQKRSTGVYLTVLGFGTGNYQDSKMQKLADKGNGNHAYIDNISEAKKILISEFGGTLFTIAKDVKLQVEFNPEKVKGYRLIGYENRVLAKEDFNNDKKDAGDMGSNHTVTALYEIIPSGVGDDEELGTVDPLRYQKQKTKKSSTSFSNELMFVKLRYKKPDEDNSKLFEVPVNANSQPASSNIRFASAVAAFGMILRNSEFKGTSNYKLVRSLAQGSIDDKSDMYKKEFLELVKKAETLKSTAKNEEED